MCVFCFRWGQPNHVVRDHIQRVFLWEEKHITTTLNCDFVRRISPKIGSLGPGWTIEELHARLILNARGVWITHWWVWDLFHVFKISVIWWCIVASFLVKTSYIMYSHSTCHMPTITPVLVLALCLALDVDVVNHELPEYFTQQLSQYSNRH